MFAFTQAQKQVEDDPKSLGLDSLLEGEEEHKAHAESSAPSESGVTDSPSLVMSESQTSNPLTEQLRDSIQHLEAGTASASAASLHSEMS